jgi:hypothetical protein
MARLQPGDRAWMQYDFLDDPEPVLVIAMGEKYEGDAWPEPPQEWYVRRKNGRVVSVPETSLHINWHACRDAAVASAKSQVRRLEIQVKDAHKRVADLESLEPPREVVAAATGVEERCRHLIATDTAGQILCGLPLGVEHDGLAHAPLSGDAARLERILEHTQCGRPGFIRGVHADCVLVVGHDGEHVGLVLSLAEGKKVAVAWE